MPESELISEKTSTYYIPRTIDTWALGITTVIGGQYFSFNAGFSAGFGSFAIATFLMGTAYVCLIACTSEMASALPFAGGAYGLARCTLGFYPGYVVGCSECLEYIIYVAVSTIFIGQMLTIFCRTPSNLEPLWWLLFYLTALGIQIKGGSFFWHVNLFLTLISLGILLIYIFGSLAYVDINKYSIPSAVNNSQLFNYTDYNGNGGNDISTIFIGGGSAFMFVFPLAAWFYVGVETLAFTSDLVQEPKKTIPLDNLFCITTLFVCSIFVLFICASLPPGIDFTSIQEFPLNTGFQHMFGLSNTNIDVNTLVIALSFPATYATAFGFIFAYGKLLSSLATSKLLPTFLGLLTTSPNSHPVPYAAMITGSLLGYSICLLVYFIPLVKTHLFSICILSGFLAYISQCIGYIFLQYKYQGIKRKTKSPLGLFGAVYAISVFTLGVVSIIGFQKDDQIAFISFVSMVAAMSVYYFTVSKFTQTFSKDEQKILFVAHVVNFNVKSVTDRGVKKRQRRMKGKDGTSVSSSAAGTLVTNCFTFILRLCFKNHRNIVYAGVSESDVSVSETDSTSNSSNSHIHGGKRRSSMNIYVSVGNSQQNTESTETNDETIVDNTETTRLSSHPHNVVTFNTIEEELMIVLENEIKI